MTQATPNAKDIFFQAATIDSPEEREAYLTEACAGHPDIRRKVDALLRNRADAGSFLENPALAAAGLASAPTNPQHSAPEIGTLIAGRYKLLQLIGEAGMGAVYMAEQTEPVRHQVALKFVKVGMGSRQVLTRFEAERQALALMEHPNIAKFLDAGATEGGQPFFVMELVRGVPLTQFCDERQLNLGARLQIFQDVCHAVQHAHQKGIIHRDLKPSNILVESHDGRPVPKVIDFGLAKALNSISLTDRSLFTNFGSILGTPLYMAPEQAELNAIDVDTRADIYALGVILYELLTGATPLEKNRLAQATWDQIRRAIKEEEPQTPSARLSTTDTRASVAALRQTEPAKLSKFVRGDLDWIVMKALAKERERRYESANDLAADVDRFLNHEAVLAGPPTVRYKVRKFLRRNRGPVLAASLVAFALVAGIVGTTLGLISANRARSAEKGHREVAEEREREAVAAAEVAHRATDTANEQRQAAEDANQRAFRALQSFTTDLMEKQFGSRTALSETEQSLVRNALTQWEVFADSKGDSAEARAIRAEGAYRVAHLQKAMGWFADAESNYRKALALWAKLALEFPHVAQYRHDQALSHNNLGVLLQDIGNWVEAEEHSTKAVDLFRERLDAHPVVTAYRMQLAGGHNNLANLLSERGRLKEAETQYRKALTLRESLVADFPDSPGDQLRADMALSHSSLGDVLKRLGKRVEAEEHSRLAVAILQKRANSAPDSPNNRADLAGAVQNLGNLLADIGKRAEAEEHCRKALTLRQELADAFPSTPDYRVALARSHHRLGVLLRDLGKYVEAETHCRKSLGLREELYSRFPGVPQYKSALASGHFNFGVVLRSMGKRAAAEEHYRKALAIQEQLAAANHDVPQFRAFLAVGRNNLGILLMEMGRRAEAEEQYRQAMAVREQLVASFPTAPDYQIDLGGSYCNFGALVRDSGRPADSLPWFDKAVRTLTVRFDQDRLSVQARDFLRNSHWGRALARDQLRHFTDADQDWARAIEIIPKDQQPALRASRATSRVQAGQIHEAIAEAAELTKSTNWKPDQWYNFACIYAVASSKGGEASAEHARRAVELLELAVSRGYKDVANLSTDKDLDTLRVRDDFKDLLEALRKKAVQPGEKK